MYKYIWVFMFFIVGQIHSQKNYATASIPENLLKNANSIIRNDKISISIPNQNKLFYTRHRAITVMSKEGNSHVAPYVNYDKSRKIKKIEAVLYNSDGKEIEKFKKKDFKDVSAVEGGTLYSDNRVKYITFNPEDYPYTLVFDYVIETDNTAAIPAWYLHTNYKSSIEEKSLTISYEPLLELRQKVFDPNKLLKINQIDGSYTVACTNQEPLLAEAYSPDLFEMIPNIIFAVDKFHLEGIDGTAKSWDEFGKWEYENFILGQGELSQETINKISELVEGAENKKKKIKLIYDYVQQNTRYISVQLGIGGFRPYPASQVDKLGYGDCKGLSNYTKALLMSQGIESYYAEVWAGNSKRNIDKDFPSLQGNHVILNVPLDEEDIWLECTSQTLPFNFLGDFTDDRDVLLLTGDGGILKRTPKYSWNTNRMKTKSSILINSEGSLSADLQMESTGIQYDNRYVLNQLDSNKKEKSYKRYWDYIDNIDLDVIEVTNNRDDIVFTEKIKLKARAYARKSRNKMFIPLNAFHRLKSIPDISSKRTNPIAIKRGFIYEDEYVINLPKDYKIESIPEPIHLNTPFGSYKTSVTKVSDTQVIFKREFQQNENTFEAEKYNEFREFLRSVRKGDNQKLIIINTSN